MALGIPLAPQDILTAGFAIPVVIFGVAALIIAVVEHKKYRSQAPSAPKELDLSGELHKSHDSGEHSWYFPLGRRVLRSRLGMAKAATTLLCFIFMLIVILLCVTFNHLPIAAGIILMIIISWTILLYCVPYQRVEHPVWWKDVLSVLKHKFLWSPILVIMGLMATLIVILALNIGLEGACMDNLDIMSTHITRSYEQPTCVAGPPCYVYLTLSRDFATSIIVNHHTVPPMNGPKKGSIPPTYVLYDTVSHVAGRDYHFSATGKVYAMPNLEVKRNVHWTHLTNLMPSTTYYFISGPGYDDNGNELWSQELKFRTGPSDDAPYVFMVGGDMGNLTAVGELTTVAAEQEPLFAVVGGDIAYEYAQTTCYRRVDTWLGNWMATMHTRDGFYIPILTAIGNHEVYGDYLAAPEQVPFYTRYFPHMGADVDPGVDDIITRPTYHEHYIGNSTIFLVLDSGHVAHPVGAQAQWLSNQLSSEEGRSRKHKFTTYHVPMYPTYRPYSTSYSALLRDAWLTIFDEYGVDVSFENHDHAYKRTYKLYNGAISTNPDVGTLFTGDGCWGVTPRKLKPDTPRWYHAYASGTQYVLRVNVSNDDVTFAALDVSGGIFDDFSL